MGSTERDDRRIERFAMLEEQLRARGIADERVLAAMAVVPRHLFLPAVTRAAAYEDRALAIGEGQTMSQPYMVARACELAVLDPEQRALEIGAGSGYQAAILSRLCGSVIAIELIQSLAERARENLQAAGIDNVRIIHGDGTQGYPEDAPYDAIVVAAGAPAVPEALGDQLAIGGRLVIPLGSDVMQTLTVLRKSPSGELTPAEYDACVYVPLRGSGGWADDERRR